MIEFVVGVPGSGKSSYAITRLAKTFIKDEELKKKLPNNLLIPDVDKAYTNINELKSDKFNNVSFFNMDWLLEKLTELEYKYRKEKWDDKQLIELATEYEINNSVFIIDECHNYFDVANKVLTWWLSYHRHLHQHIILLTQNISLVNQKYKAFPEIFLKAIPATLKIFDSNIILKKYTSSRLSKTTQAGQIKIKKHNEIFELYGSGANHKSKSVILPYIIFSLVLIFIIFIYFKFFRSSAPVVEEYENKVKSKIEYKKINKVENEDLNKTNKTNKSNINISGRILINFYCNYKECYHKDIFLPFGLIDKLKDLNSEVLFKVKMTENITKYVVLFDTSFYSLLGIENKTFILGVQNENKSENSNFYNVTNK